MRWFLAFVSAVFLSTTVLAQSDDPAVKACEQYAAGQSRQATSQNALVNTVEGFGIGAAIGGLAGGAAVGAVVGGTAGALEARSQKPSIADDTYVDAFADCMAKAAGQQ